MHTTCVALEGDKTWNTTLTFMVLGPMHRIIVVTRHKFAHHLVYTNCMPTTGVVCSHLNVYVFSLEAALSNTKCPVARTPTTVHSTLVYQNCPSRWWSCQSC